MEEFVPPITAQAASEPTNGHDAESSAGLYVISVAARLLGMHPQTLRKYERLGLVRPSRTAGMLRMYSEEDLTKLRLIRHLAEEQRMNLAGIQLVLALLSRFLEVRRRMVHAASIGEAQVCMEEQLQAFLEDLGLLRDGV